MLHESPSIRVELDDQIATLWLDCRNRSDNRFTLETLDELAQALHVLKRVPCLDILVVRSAKPTGFSPGYDLEKVANFRTGAEASAFAGRGQQVAQMLASFSSRTVTVAVVEGECRSAGLELALACDYRLALVRPDTLFGFPERGRGLIPAWGGTLRLPRLLGLNRALEMLIRGRELSAGEAFAWGLVDRVFGERRARIDLQAFLDRLQDFSRKLSSPRSVGSRIRDSLGLARWASFQRIGRSLADVDDAECPAARAILKAVRLGYSSPAECLAAERYLLAELAETNASRNSVANERRAAQPARIHPEPINPVPTLPERIGIVGGGELGSALAVWLALRGRQVALQEADDDALLMANDRLDAQFKDATRRGLTTPLEADQAKKSIRRTTSWNGFDEVALVIEAVDEDLGIKRGIVYELEQRIRPRTIIASASRTVRIEAIQAEMQRPGRVLGLHFLDAKLANPLVEIVRSPSTDSGTFAALDSWLRSWGKCPILVGDRPGRLVQRIQLAYLSEAVVLVAEGLPPELIDREMRRFGMKRGPLETIDAIGFDNLARFVENLQLARGDTFARNLMLDRMRALSWNGRENGEGFYRYRGRKAWPNHLARMVLWHDVDEDVVSHYVFDPRESLDDGVERLVLRTINEAAACLAEERDADPATIDLALAWGAEWAPHRGGPLRHADALGLVSVVERLSEFAERFGKRFEPCVELQRRAEAGESFHGWRTIEEIVEFPAPRRLAG